MLANALRTRLATIPGITIHDPGLVRCGIVSFTAAGNAPEEIQRALALSKINVTVSRRPSTRLDMEARDLTGLLRASVHYYNSEDEVERFCTTVASLLCRPPQEVQPILANEPL